MESRQVIRVFVSSPGDVGHERLIVHRVIEKLQGQFRTRFKLDPIFWEHEPVRGTADYQSQFPLPSSCDIVICILWSRLGTRLPDQFGTKPDGSPWRSGTEFEFFDAQRAFEERGVPDLLVYRKTTTPYVDLSDREKVEQSLAQREALKQFIDEWGGNAETGITAATNLFSDPAQFEDLVEMHLTKILESRLPTGVCAEDFVPAAWHSGSPFRGLEPFEAEHSAVFFGRTRAIAQVKDRLCRLALEGNPFLLVLGASGSGKSSLLRAGIVPTLTAPGVVEGVGLWRAAILRPGDFLGNPCESLTAALLAPMALPELASQGFERSQLLRQLREAPQLLDQPVQGALRFAAQETARLQNLTRLPATRLLLIVDQFEQLFTIPSIDEGDGTRFLIALDSLIRSGMVWVVAAMRSDFYHRCTEFPLLQELRTRGGSFDLAPPGADEIRQIVTLPAKAAGLVYEGAEGGDRLDALLLEACIGNPASLPLLEFALEELYRRAQVRGENLLSLSDYRGFGGLEGAVARRAEEVFEVLPREVRDSFGEVMAKSVNIGSTMERTALPVPLAKFAEATPGRRLVEALVQARLMVSDQHSDGSAFVRLAHDSLLTHWPRLCNWIAENEDRLRSRERLLVSAGVWLQSDRNPDFLLNEGLPLLEALDLQAEAPEILDETLGIYIRESTDHVERSRKRRRRTILATAAAFLLTAAIGGGWVLTERTKRAFSETLVTLNQNYVAQIQNVLASAQIGSSPAVAQKDLLSYSLHYQKRLLASAKKSSSDVARYARLVKTAARIDLDDASLETGERRAVEAAELFEELPPAEASKPLNRLAAFENRQNRIEAILYQYRFAEAEAEARDLVDDARALARSEPSNLEYQNVLSATRRQLANCLNARGDSDTARRLLREILEELRPRLSDEPAKPNTDGEPTEGSSIAAAIAHPFETRRLLARTLLNASDSHEGWESAATLEAWDREALKLAELAAQDDPGNSALALLLAESRIEYGDRLLQTDPEEGRRLFQEALNAANGVALLNPKHEEWRRVRMYASFLVTDSDRKSESIAEGVEALRRDLDADLNYLREHPENTFVANRASGLKRFLANRLLQLEDVPPGDAAEAARLILEARDENAARVRQDPENWIARQGRLMDGSFCRSLDLPGAAEDYERSLEELVEYWRGKAREHPENPSWSLRLAESLARRAFESRVLSPVEVAAAYTEALALYDQLYETHPEEWPWASFAADLVLKWHQKEALVPDRLVEAEALVENGQKRFESLLAIRPDHGPFYEGSQYFQGIRLWKAREAAEPENWAEVERLLRESLDFHGRAYEQVPSTRPGDLFQWKQRPQLASVRQGGEMAFNPKRSKDLARGILEKQRTLFSIQADPPELHRYRLYDALLDLLDFIAKFPPVESNGVSIEESRGALRLAAYYLDRVEDAGLRHPILGTWREAVKMTLGSLPPDIEPLPADLQPYHDALDYRSVVTGWFARGGNPSRVLQWLDREAQIAREATWRQPALLSLAFLAQEDARRLLDLAEIDATLHSDRAHRLSDDVIPYLAVLAAAHGDALAWLQLIESGRADPSLPTRLKSWADRPSGDPDPDDPGAAFPTASQMSNAELLAVAPAGSRIQVSKNSLITASVTEAAIAYGQMHFDAGDSLLAELDKVPQLRPRTLAFIEVARGERLLLSGNLPDARKHFEAAHRLAPESRVVLQDLVWLGLEERDLRSEREQTGRLPLFPEGEGISPSELDQLRLRLLQERVPNLPFQRLLSAWWNAAETGAGGIVDGVASQKDDPATASLYTSYLLARIAEGSGEREKARSFLEDAIARIQDPGQCPDILTRFNEYLATLK